MRSTETQPDGRERLVRHGHGPERTIQTGIGPVAVSRVKIRDRGATSEADRKAYLWATEPWTINPLRGMF